MVPFMTRLPSGKCSLVKSSSYMSSSYMFGRSTMSTYTAVSPWTRSQVASSGLRKLLPFTVASGTPLKTLVTTTGSLKV